MKFFQAYYMHLLIFLSLTATSPAVANYAKPGCVDTCGNNVVIPFPFGIRADCAVNNWYIVDCNNAKPYLSALNHLEVLGVSLKNQTVTVSTPTITNCQNPVWNSSKTMSMNLGVSPFLFSKSHNKFVFEGCGTAAMMDDRSVLTGCSAACHNSTHNDRNNCYGIGCCQTAIPRYLRSYSINITTLGEGGRACGSAFLVDEASYDEGRFSDPFISRNVSFIPVSLLWTLTDSDQINCCDKDTPSRRKVDMFNGIQVDTLKCTYLFFLVSAPTSKYAKTGCIDKCGNVTIPYPFGIGVKCSVNEWYTVECNSSTPYLPALNHLKVLGVDLL